MDSLAQVSQPTSPGRGDYFHSNGGFRSKKRRGDRPQVSQATVGRSFSHSGSCSFSCKNVRTNVQQSKSLTVFRLRVSSQDRMTNVAFHQLANQGGVAIANRA
jgi:hypothetical protein